MVFMSLSLFNNHWSPYAFIAWKRTAWTFLKTSHIAFHKKETGLNDMRTEYSILVELYKCAKKLWVVKCVYVCNINTKHILASTYKTHFDPANMTLPLYVPQSHFHIVDMITWKWESEKRCTHKSSQSRKVCLSDVGVQCFSTHWGTCVASFPLAKPTAE